jgi:hypothetical protein
LDSGVGAIKQIIPAIRWKNQIQEQFSGIGGTRKGKREGGWGSQTELATA